MVLQRLQLTNFRGFESLDLTFEPDLTVIVGVNGCGKTSILDALAIMLRLRTREAQDTRTGTSRGSISLQLDGTGQTMWLPSPAPTGFPEVLALFYRVNRAVSDGTPGTTRPRAWTKADAQMKEGADPYSDLFDWIREAEDAENERVRYERATEDPQLHAVRHAVERLLPGYTNLRVRRRGAMGDSRPRLTVEKDGTVLLFDALSEGERTLVAMIADIARRLAIAHPDSPTPLEQPCLLVIEGFQLLEGAHREGQDVNEILEALFGTPSRRKETQALIDAIRNDLDEDDLDQADAKLGELTRQLGSDDPEVVRLTTFHRMLGAMDQDAVSEK